MSNDINSSAGAINALEALARRADVPSYYQIGGKPLVRMPGQSAYISLESHMAKPLRKRASVTLLDAASLIGYVNKHKAPGTQILGVANEEGGEFNALLDYHLSCEEVAAQGNLDANPARWVEHKAGLKLRTTPEWDRWLGKDGDDLTQSDFAVFIEDNAQDIVVPDSDLRAPNSAQMMDIALTLQAKTGIEFSSAKRLQDGQQRLTYNEIIDAKAGPGGDMAIPAKFYISVPPFVGSARYLVSARLRFRVGGGRVIFKYELERIHKIVEAAFNDQRELIEKDTGLKVLLGSVMSVGL